MSNNNNRIPITIVLEEDDDEDDVRPVSPPPVSVQTSSFSYAYPLHIPVLDDDELELRLGPADNGFSVTTSARLSRPEPSLLLSVSSYQEPLHFRPTIDLTCTNDNFEEDHKMSRKRKRGLPYSDPSQEIRLTCAICMDTMEEETSTICGHIFCWKCIVEAIRMQKKCPTCRRRLVNNTQIHRVYIS